MTSYYNTSTLTSLSLSLIIVFTGIQDDVNETILFTSANINFLLQRFKKKYISHYILRCCKQVYKSYLHCNHGKDTPAYDRRCETNQRPAVSSVINQLTRPLLSFPARMFVIKNKKIIF